MPDEQVPDGQPPSSGNPTPTHSAVPRALPQQYTDMSNERIARLEANQETYVSLINSLNNGDSKLFKLTGFVLGGGMTILTVIIGFVSYLSFSVNTQKIDDGLKRVDDKQRDLSQSFDKLALTQESKFTSLKSDQSAALDKVIKIARGETDRHIDWVTVEAVSQNPHESILQAGTELTYINSDKDLPRYDTTLYLDFYFNAHRKDGGFGATRLVEAYLRFDGPLIELASESYGGTDQVLKHKMLYGETVEVSPSRNGILVETNFHSDYRFSLGISKRTCEETSSMLKSLKNIGNLGHFFITPVFDDLSIPPREFQFDMKLGDTVEIYSCEALRGKYKN